MKNILAVGRERFAIELRRGVGRGELMRFYNKEIKLGSNSKVRLQSCPKTTVHG